jgi:secretion/DNA translocation related TadE-like protein
MPGSALTVGLIGAAALLTVGLASVGSASVLGQRLGGAADAAALAAADAASGAVTGVPCERAAEIAAVAGVALEACELDELVATVTVSARFGILPATASARAGPPS